MCKRPISLRNPSTAWNYLNDAVNISVPCGCCSDCENKSRFEWQVRVYYEYLRCHDIGGFTIYATFTYDDEHLPLAYVDRSGRARVDPRRRKKYFVELPQTLRKLLEDDPKAIYDEDNSWIKSIETDEIVEDTVMSCFNKADIQKFTKQVDDVCRIRGEKFGYMVTSEYGHYGKYIDHHGRPQIGTSRPHYHGLFFFDGNITPKEASEILRSHWQNLGMIEIGGEKQDPNEYGVVNGAGAIGYVCKYLQKSRDNAESLRKHLLLSKDGWLDVDKKRLNRNFSSFHTQSYGLGLYCLVDTPDDLLHRGKTKYPMYDEDGHTVKMMVVDLPLYLERKLFCFPQKEVPNRSYIYNSDGVRLRSERLKEHRDKLVESINDFLQFPDQYITSPAVLRHISHALGKRTKLPRGDFDKEKIDPGYLRPRDFALDIRKALDTFTVENMVDYALLFQGLVDTVKLDYSKNDHNVQLAISQNSILSTLRYLDFDGFINAASYRYTKDRSRPYSLNPAKEAYFNNFRFFIPQLEKALTLYHAYIITISKNEEFAIVDKINRENRNKHIYTKELYYLKPSKYA